MQSAIYITPLNFHNNPSRQVLLLIPTLKMRILSLIQIKKISEDHAGSE